MFADGRTVVAPFYDLVCTNNYPQLSKRLAMSIGGEFMPGAIKRNNLTVFARELDVSETFLIAITRETIERLIDSLDGTTKEFQDRYGNSPILQRILRIVRNRCKRALKHSLGS